VIVGGIIHLPAEFPTAQHGHQEGRRQQPGVRCCSSPASLFHSFSIVARAGDKPNAVRLSC
jgi:hypothetical protein